MWPEINAIQVTVASFLAGTAIVAFSAASDAADGQPAIKPAIKCEALVGLSFASSTIVIDQEAALNFAHASVGKVTAAAKAIIARYYGQPPARSYFVGCSTGGREGMLASQRYPAEYDGIVAGAPLHDRCCNPRSVRFAASDRRLGRGRQGARCGDRHGSGFPPAAAGRSALTHNMRHTKGQGNLEDAASFECRD
jgi:hypothetical protein